MFVRKEKNKQRFSLLLLEPGELYFDDHSVFMLEGDGEVPKRKIRGRLKICSKSLVFDPQDSTEPILKFGFKDIQRVGEQRGGQLMTSQEVLVVESTRSIQMRINNVVGPYVLRQERREYRFALNFSKMGALLPKVEELLKISQQPLLEREHNLSRLVQELRSSTPFDVSWLRDLHERIVLEADAVHVTPLVSNPGRVVLTDARLYFQPFNNADSLPLSHFALGDVTRIIRRRHLLRHVALEIFFKAQDPLFLSFQEGSLRDRILETLLSLPGLNSLEKEETSNYTLKWQNGLISNYDYLIYLNSMADRTINDLTQYPVFPWVIADYKSEHLDLTNPKTFRDLSKPIGALDPERLSTFKKRYREMPEPKFLYGTHYSTPGYVLYYLVRAAPEYMLCLQNGKFDHPDRLFNSIADTWEGVLTNPTDVKELIPEFFALPSKEEEEEEEEKGTFLVNWQHLDLGTRHHGQKVNHVQLPAWASDDVDFVRKNREALESEHASRHLHQWIDLIFGYKQRGEEAVRADNLFYYLTYEGAVDIDDITDPIKRAAIEVQINEFGQTPKQLFKIPQPKKAVVAPLLAPSSSPSPSLSPSSSLSSLPSAHPRPDTMTSPPSLSLSSSLSSSSSLSPSSSTTTLLSPAAPTRQPFARWTKLPQMAPIHSYKIHKDKVTSLCLSANGETIYSVSQDASLKIYSVKDKMQLRSINVSELALSSCALSDDGDKLAIGCWDNHVYLYSIPYSRVLDTLAAHDDAISCLALRQNILVTASWDSSIKVWQCELGGGMKGQKSTQIAELAEHDSEVRSIDLDGPPARIIAAGCVDGSLAFWDLTNLEGGCVRTLQAHEGTVTSVKLTADGQRVVSSGEDGVIKVHEVFGGEVFSAQCEEPISSVLSDGQFILCGTSSGKLLLFELVSGHLLSSFNAHPSPISSLSLTPDAAFIASAADDGSIKVWAVPQ